MDKQFPIKQRGDSTCMIDFVWHHCKNKKGFKTYTYKKINDEMSEYAACFPMMSTQELVDWARACHPNVSIHAYDATYRKFLKHLGTSHDKLSVYFVKDHHCYGITDERLKIIATKANQGGTDNLWKYMSDMKWSRRHEQFVVLNDLGEEEELDISGQVIVLPEDVKIEPVVDRYILRTNYFVEYLHLDNNGRLDGFLDHKNNMYVLNNEYDLHKEICNELYDKHKTNDFVWSHQSYTCLATSLYKQMCGYLPESQYDKKTAQVLDDFYLRALQWCSTNEQPDNLVSLDISKCYPSILIDNKTPIPVYTIHDVMEPFTHRSQLNYHGEFYIDEYVLQRFGASIKIEAGFYSRDLIWQLVNNLHMPTSNVKWCITTKKTLKPDTFRNFMLHIFDTFTEAQAKLLANAFIGELGRKYIRTNHGFHRNSGYGTICDDSCDDVIVLYAS